MKKVLSSLCLLLMLVTLLVPMTLTVSAETVKTDTIQSEIQIATTPNSVASTKQVRFDTPLDCSGSDGYIVLSEIINSKLAVTLRIYTTDAIGKAYRIGSSQRDILGAYTTEISLETMGLTDDSLSSITGYDIITESPGNSVYYTYSIKVPKASSYTLASRERLTVNANKTETKNVRFDSPLDCSGSNGYLILNDTINNVHAVTLRIYTTNKTSNAKRIGASNRNGTGEYNNIIPLSEIGLTDEDIASITGYDITTDSATATVYYDYSITIPKKIETPAAETAIVKESTTVNTKANWSSLITTEFFKTPINSYGSNGNLILYHSRKAKTKLTLTLYTASGNSKRVILDNQNLTESADKFTKLSLADDLGLTEESLKYIIGYQLIISAGGNPEAFTYGITIPRQTVASDVIEEYATVNSGDWGNIVETKTVNYDTFRDFSTNSGYIEIEYSSTVGRPDSDGSINLTFTLMTLTKTVTKASGFLPYKIANSKQKYLIYFDELGLTNEELSETTGYSIRITQNSNKSEVSFAIKVPSLVPNFSSEANIHLPYDYVDGDLRIMPNTLVAEVKNNYPYAVIMSGEEAVTEGIVKTGMAIKLVYNNKIIDTAGIIVYDDIDKDGLFSSTDLTMVKKALMEEIELDDEQMAAIAYHGDTFDIRILISMKKVLTGDLIVGQVSTGEWKADKFYLSSGRIPSTAEGLANYKELGYNMAEVIVNPGEDIDEILSLIDTIGGIDTVITDSNYFTLSNNELLNYSENAIRKAVQKYSKYKSIIGYEVFDEIKSEASNYSDALAVSGYLNKYDPNSLKFINLLPSYGDYTWENNKFASYVSKYIEKMNPQVLSFDYYPYLMKTYGETSDWWRDLGLFRTKSIEHDIPFWYYYQGIAIADEAKPTNEQIKYQMYVGLAYGAKQLSEWVAVSDGLNSDGTRSNLFDETKARNAEVMAVGNFLFDKKSSFVYHTGLSTEYFDDFYLDSISESALINSASDDLIISVFEDDTETKYMLVVNKDTEKAAAVNIVLDNIMTVSKFNKSGGNEISVGNSDTISFELAAGSGELYILK